MSKENLQLPKTAFSMKASLPTKEPLILEKWEKNKIFETKDLVQLISHVVKYVGEGVDNQNTVVRKSVKT